MKPSTQKFEYIVLTPISPDKEYSLDRFLKSVSNFKPAPKEMVFCCEPENVAGISKWRNKLKAKAIDLIIFTIRPETKRTWFSNEIKRPKPVIEALRKSVLLEGASPGGLLEKIEESRNILREHFLNSDFQWAFHLDSDIILQDSNSPSVFYKTAHEKKSLLVLNSYPSSDTGSDSVWHGAGCMFMNRAIAHISPFFVAPFVFNGEVGTVSEDFTFLSLVRACSPFIKAQFGWSGEIQGRFVPVIHEFRPGRDKFLDKEETEPLDK